MKSYPNTFVINLQNKVRKIIASAAFLDHLRIFSDSLVCNSNLPTVIAITTSYSHSKYLYNRVKS